ncbi:hypothetical protein [Pseudomarimonas arenosa]|uniref:Uncharacterized protein n=1 Tax=Pseudomarimonas arenosa TaxID=2774145 RepID=A0AAW3ZTQ1_9GAMM|nr:hypothetical protein [Pseudomarimonas arenosa]MBD8528309.1 hypothetical protein [Pseudomarimonas arenosa]
MGYDMHITRKPQWFDDDGPEISLDEWKAYLFGESQFASDGSAEVRSLSGAVLRLESEGLAAWCGYSAHEPGGNMAWFLYTKGNLVVKNPDEETRRKMYQVAVALGARVQGDEGEFYGADGEQLNDAPPAASSTATRPWWRFWS